MDRGVGGVQDITTFLEKVWENRGMVWQAKKLAK